MTLELEGHFLYLREATLSEQRSGQPHCFIVRIRREGDDSAVTALRGSVEHVPSHRRRYFTTLGELNVFIESLLDESGAQPLPTIPPPATVDFQGDSV
jgi:hypothetical protein